MDPHPILVVGADPAARELLAEAVAAAGHRPFGATGDAADWGSRVRESAVVVVDARSLGPVAEDLLTACRRTERPVPCVVALREASVEECVAWMRRGAYGVVELPVRTESFGMHLDQALQHRELSLRNAELERSLESHERLAMIGKLAAGVAHELNNPLDGVLRYVNLAVEKLPRESPQVTYLHEARRGLRRMADIVRDLLQFSRNASVESADEDAARLARDAVEQVVQGHARDRRIETRYEFPDAGIHLPRGMFQVFGNLARNAVDAMPSGGTIRVAAALASGRVRIEFADSGSGIPDDIRDRIFEPFFTTKEVGKGTGLGLPICQRIVERLGGSLSLESEVGVGTTVRIELPARRAPAPGVPRSPSAARRAEGVF